MERMTKNRWSILLALYESAPDGLSGVDLSDQLGIASGSLYPSLRQLRNGPLVETTWNLPDNADNGDRPMRYYRLSPDGVALAKAKLNGQVDSADAWRRFITPMAAQPQALLRWFGR